MNDETPDHDPEDPWQEHTDPAPSPDEGLNERDLLLRSLLRETPADLDPDIAARAVATALAEVTGAAGETAQVSEIGSRERTAERRARRAQLIGVAAGVALLVLVSLGALLIRHQGSSSYTTADRAASNPAREDSADSSGTSPGMNPTTTAPTGNAGAAANEPTSKNPNDGTSIDDSPSGNGAEGSGGEMSSEAVTGSFELPYGGSFTDATTALSGVASDAAPPLSMPTEVGACMEALTNRGFTPLLWVLIGDVPGVIAAPAPPSAPAVPDQAEPAQDQSNGRPDRTDREVFRASTCRLWN